MSYKCEPLSREFLREYALNFRKIFGLEDELLFPIVSILDLLPELFSNFSYEVVDDDLLPGNKFAETDVENSKIFIKQSVYEGACNKNGMDRFTIAHEIGHFLLLNILQVKYVKTIGSFKKYEDPEWQADAFAGELLVPHHLIKNCGTASIIAKKCEVSLKCAQVQIKKQ